MSRLTSMGTKLSMKTTSEGTYAEIPDVKGYPSFMGAPERVETTCVSDTQKTYGPGQKDPGEMDFTLAYSGMGATSNWGLLRAVELSGNAAYFKVEYPDDTGFEWTATVALSMNEVGDGNSPLEFTCSMFPSDEITPIGE